MRYPASEENRSFSWWSNRISGQAGQSWYPTLSNAIRNCPLCVMKNCPHHRAMISVEGCFRRWRAGGRRSRPEGRHRRSAS